MYKIAKIIAIILGVIGLVLWVLIARSDDNGSYIDVMLNLGIGLTIIAAVITLLFSIVGLASDTDKLKKSLISIAVFALVLIVSYFLATGTDVDLQKMADRGIQVTEGTVKTVGAGLISFYILTVLAILAMIIGGFKKQ
ncbi:hypothetical protein [Galbibacter pacificus]|uniref:MotA/TolQ/ExbB proton channel domain-containing protein n=1 Tax=Galbibacter pacificus TaxID=2996052 RepID=A0ABT6FTI8_9FLAO|nr:hypothetical protein [Galbibacter pacificus]MDG3583102.1 hypothetical protein [Galbibacter pacificus]MDG3586583.1 hypothetical protein [Galbibacter pacificus]